jgi:predicted patatin/cPLA2 family phospholipase
MPTESSPALHANILLYAFFSLSLCVFLLAWSFAYSALIAVSVGTSFLASTRSDSALSSSLIAAYARARRYSAFAASILGGQIDR